MNYIIKVAGGQWIALFALAVTLAMPGQVAYAESDHYEPHNETEHEDEDDHGEEGEHEDEDEGHIELTPEQIEHANIGLAQVASANIRESLPLYGVVMPNAERVQSVGARFDGVIRTVTKKIGDVVKKGETLLTVESNESSKTYSVVSSQDGVITERNANVGEQTADKTLFVVADFSTVWIELSLFPSDIAKVNVGQRALIKSNNTTLTTEGEVIYVAPFGSHANQTVTARVLLENPNRRWLPGLFISGELTLSETPVTLAVRNESVQMMEERSVVFVKGEEGFEPRPVTLGRTDGEVSEVLAGLQEDETYVTRNSFILKSELGKEGAEHGH